MNRELFISDSQRIFRQFGEKGFHEAMADYVEKIPFDPNHALVMKTVDKYDVIRVCCKHFKVSLIDMIKPGRKIGIKEKRQITVYLLETRTRMNQTEIGRLFQRDRTTVAATKRRIQDLMDTDLAVREEIAYLNSLL